jgi:hypothetical protein
MSDRDELRLLLVQDGRRACGSTELATMFGIGGRHAAAGNTPSVSAVAPARGEGVLPTPSSDEAFHVH